MPAATKQTPQRWVKVAVDYYRNPKIIISGIYSELAYVRLLAIARERIEMEEKDGIVPLVLAIRELRDIADIATEGDVMLLLKPLAENNLITIGDVSLVIEDYSRWQTTRSELEQSRAIARERALARREKENSVEKPVKKTVRSKPAQRTTSTSRAKAPAKKATRRVAKKSTPKPSA